MTAHTDLPPQPASFASASVAPPKKRTSFLPKQLSIDWTRLRNKFTPSSSSGIKRAVKQEPTLRHTTSILLDDGPSETDFLACNDHSITTRPRGKSLPARVLSWRSSRHSRHSASSSYI
ncbi:Aste57867_2099 [Aphanomyces stellatus]|uniref:Aste57867_2099 protein n=1 Tax=Aphanomyces stellatus TaxID=120398 RepID=A0A485KAF8_9STRA|nr:hypothetical protein As57867_002094 [Aphanomyces stellatus]VFT79302.1 Aste57867_2099 [Aphanomyces stellatus]